MNYCKHLFSLLLILSSLYSLHGQTNKKPLNYQAVILDPKAIDIPGAIITGQPLNKGNVCLRFSLMNAQGGLDYEETQQVTTDEYGLVNVAIGAGTQASSNSTSIYKSFESVVWTSSVKSLKVSVSFDGCSSFKQVSTQVLYYTPYALYAEAVDYKNVRDAPTKLSQFSNDVGYLIPKDLDPIKADIKSNTSQIAMANQTIADNKKSSDAAFLIVNQSITSLDTKVAENTTAIFANTGSINTINSKLTDQQNQISDNRNQITATNNSLNSQIGGLQGQINNTNSAVSNLSGAAEVVSNKSLSVQTDGTDNNKYPSVKAVKDYVDQATLGTSLAADLANKANINSQIFTGTPSLPTGTTGVTQTAGDNSTKLATTAYVATAVSAVSGGGTVTGVPYTGATAAVNLGSYDLTVNSLTIGLGNGNISTNTAVGYNALAQNTTGSFNTANGYSTLYSNTTGNYNVANGNQALYSNTTGGYNVASGNQALYSNTTGGYNVASGNQALYSNTAGSRNTASGYQTLYSNTTGGYNTAVGHQALYSNTTGVRNIAVGHSALYKNTTGEWNVAIGIQALYYNSTGSQNIAIGNNTLNYNTSGINNIALGVNVLNYNTSGINNIAIGTSALGSNTTGNSNVANGVFSLGRNTTGGYNTANGNYSLFYNTTGNYNVANGNQALYSNTTGEFNTANGAGSLYANTTGSNNSANGNNSLGRNTTGGSNTANGYSSLYSNTTGQYNTANGSSSLQYNTTGTGNVANGYQALHLNTTGGYNVANGSQALYSNTTGYNNIAIGNSALFYNTTTNYNTAIGYASLLQSTGSNNTALGNFTGNSLQSGDNNTMIGAGSQSSSSSVSNEITLGNGLVATLRAQVTSITALSDRRDKTNIIPIGEGLEFLKKLNPVSFTWNTRDKAKVGIKSAGFIAQELLDLQKRSNIGDNLDLVSENNPEKLEARYGNLLPVIVKAIQEESAEKDKEIKALKERLNALEKLLNEWINKK